MNLKFKLYKILTAIFLTTLFLSLAACDNPRERHDSGMIRHPHSDPYGPKDSTMVSDDTTHGEMQEMPEASQD